MRHLRPRGCKGEWNVGKRCKEVRKKQDLVTDWKMWHERKGGRQLRTSAPGSISQSGVFHFYNTTSSLKENCFYFHSTDRRIQISQTYASLLRYQVLQLSETERGGGTYVFRKETNPSGGGVGRSHSRQKWSFSGKLLEGRDNVLNLLCWATSEKVGGDDGSERGWVLSPAESRGRAG